MSKSYRKHPIVSVCTIREREVKEWKTKCSRQLRRSIRHMEELPQGTIYRKLHDTEWDSPRDGKSYHNEEKELKGRDWWQLMGK